MEAERDDRRREVVDPELRRLLPLRRDEVTLRLLLWRDGILNGGAILNAAALRALEKLKIRVEATGGRHDEPRQLRAPATSNRR